MHTMSAYYNDTIAAVVPHPHAQREDPVRLAYTAIQAPEGRPYPKSGIDNYGTPIGIILYSIFMLRLVPTVILGWRKSHTARRSRKASSERSEQNTYIYSTCKSIPCDGTI